MDHPGPIESHKRELVAGDIPTKEDDTAPVVLDVEVGFNERQDRHPLVGSLVWDHVPNPTSGILDITLPAWYEVKMAMENSLPGNCTRV